MKNNIIKILLILNIVIISNTNSMSALHATFIRGLGGTLAIVLGYDLFNKKIKNEKKIIENENKINDKTLNAKIRNEEVLNNSITNILNYYAFLLVAAVFPSVIYNIYKQYSEKSNIQNKNNEIQELANS